MRIEHWFYSLPLRLRSLFRHGKVEAELEEEMRFHLEQRIEQNLADGMSREEARYSALRAMEGMEQQKEACRDARRLNLIESSWRDLVYAARVLRKSPAFAAVAILSLALGMGANTAIFTLIDGLLLRPLAVPHPQQLAMLGVNSGGNGLQYSLTYPMFEQLLLRNRVFSSLFTWSSSRFQLRTDRQMIHVDGVAASGGYFRGLAIAPEKGRYFDEQDDKPTGGSGGPVAVISDEFWTSYFGRKDLALGSTLPLDGLGYTVIGVMPHGFFGAEVGTKPQVWVPLQVAGHVADAECMKSPNCWWLTVMGRRREGVSARAANSQLAVISPEVMKGALPETRHPDERKSELGWRFETSPGENGWTELRERFTHPLTILMILVGLVLLIACANLTNLLLSRASARSREIAIRLAIGAGRGRIIRQLLIESLLLAFSGAALGACFSVWFTRLLVTFVAVEQGSAAGEEALRDVLTPDWRVAAFTAAAAIICALLFGLFPALRSTRVGIGAALKERVQNIRGAGHAGFGRVLLAFQCALSVLLVCGAGLFAGSLWRLLTTNPGFNPHGLILLATDTGRLKKNEAAVTEFYNDLSARLRATPGVQAASAMVITPLSRMGWNEVVAIPGRHDLPEKDRIPWMNGVGPHYFQAMGTRVLAGREFTEADSANAERVCILDRAAARRYFPNSDPIGQRLAIDEPKKPAVMRIVGVVDNTKYLTLREEEHQTVFMPFAQNRAGIASMSFAVRSSLPPEAIVRSFRELLRKNYREVPLTYARTMDEEVARSLGRERLMASLSVFFGALALILTSIGLYGLLAYSVAARTGEIGIRMALGAQRPKVVWLVVREAALQVLAGVAAGIGAVLAMSRLVASLLYGLKPNDAGTLLAAAAALLATAALAAYLPARRASRLDPMQALREE